MAHYINMNYEGLKDDIIRMLAGGRCSVDPKLADYADRLLLVAINYDRESKVYSCSIEAAKGA